MNFVSSLEVEDSEFETLQTIGIPSGKRGQLSTGANRDSVDFPFDFVAIDVDDDLQGASNIEVLHVASVVFVVVAVAGVEPDHVVVDVAEAAVCVITVEHTERKPAVVSIVDFSHRQVEFVNALGKHCVLGLEFVPVVGIILFK